MAAWTRPTTTRITVDAFASAEAAAVPMPVGPPSFRAAVRGGRRDPADNDLTQGQGGEPLGERIIVTGGFMDQRRVARSAASWWKSGKPTPPGAIATPPIAPCPARPAFRRRRPVSDRRRRPLPVRHDQARSLPVGKPRQNAWRPAHIHFSAFGTCFTERLVTQMYFPGDPLLAFDPIFQSIRDRQAAEMLCQVRPRQTADDGRLVTCSTLCSGGAQARPPEIEPV